MYIGTSESELYRNCFGVSAGTRYSSVMAIKQISGLDIIKFSVVVNGKYT